MADEDMSNNSSTVNFNVLQTALANYSLKVDTDSYGSESDWEIKNSNGNIVVRKSDVQSGAYSNSSTYNHNLTLASADCYTLHALDSYGDGGATYTLKDGANITLTAIPGNSYKTEGTGTWESTFQDLNAPTVDVNNGAVVDFNSAITISKPLLESKDAEINDKDIVYTVVTAPTHGRLKRLTANNITSFTQDDINKNKISYVHSDVNDIDDSFEFTISDGLNAAPMATFNIVVNPDPSTSTSISELKNGSVSVFPNPIVNVANVVLDLTINSNVKVELTNILGEVVYSENLGTVIGNKTVQVNTENLTKGTYMMNVYVGNETISQKLVK